MSFVRRFLGRLRNEKRYGSPAGIDLRNTAITSPAFIRHSIGWYMAIKYVLLLLVDVRWALGDECTTLTWMCNAGSSTGAWVAQSVKCLTLDFCSGHDLTVHEFEPCIRLYADREEPAWDSLSPTLSLLLPSLHTLFQKISINLKKM